MKLIFHTLFFPGLTFTGVLGLFFAWIDRKITARIHSRIGPPWYQCYADTIKLMGKTMIIPRESRKSGFLLAPLIGLAGVTQFSTLIWRVNMRPDVGFMGDLIVALYLLILPSLALILGGSSSRNPFAAVGTAREMNMILGYELPFLIAVITIIVKTKTLLLGEIIEWQQVQGVLLANPSCLLAFIVCLICMQAKLGYNPFDIAEAETEIIGGTLAEYSGVFLAVFKLTNAMMLVILPVFLVTLFMGGISFDLKGILVASAEYAGILLLIVIVKATHPRLRIDQAIRFFWWLVTPLAIGGLILALVGV